jgi:hypothetical protein
VEEVGLLPVSQEICLPHPNSPSKLLEHN